MTKKALPPSFGMEVDLIDSATLDVLRPCEPIIFYDPKSFDVIEAWAIRKKDKIKSVVAKVGSYRYSFFYTDRKQYPINMFEPSESDRPKRKEIVTRFSHEFVEHCVSGDLKRD